MDRRDEIVFELERYIEVINHLRQEYMELVKPCQNKNCLLYDEKIENHCKERWDIHNCEYYMEVWGDEQDW